jgi:hypothetical protein
MYKCCIRFYIVVFFFLALFALSCEGNKETFNNDLPSRYEELINIKGELKHLNQVILIDKSGKIDKSSHYYETYKNCIQYHSYLDTLNLEVGKKRFIVFKTSQELASDFSNVDSLTMKKYFFKDKNVLCLKGKTPHYGVIEDIVFIDTDSLVDGEKAVRIVKQYTYINLGKNALMKKVGYEMRHYPTTH